MIKNEISSEEIFSLVGTKHFSKMIKVEAIEFSEDKIKMSFNFFLVSLEEVVIVSLRKEVLRLSSKVIYLGLGKTKESKVTSTINF